MLYSAHSMGGREPNIKVGNLMSGTSFPTFRRILEALSVEWWNLTPRSTQALERRNRNINLDTYFISSSGDRTHNQWNLQSHFVPPALQLDLKLQYKSYFIIYSLELYYKMFISYKCHQQFNYQFIQTDISTEKIIKNSPYIKRNKIENPSIQNSNIYLYLKFVFVQANGSKIYRAFLFRDRNLANSLSIDAFQFDVSFTAHIISGP